MTRGNRNHFTIEALHYLSGNSVRVEINDGTIEDITPAEGLETVCNNIFIAPGLIDNQINGYANIDFSGNDLSVESFTTAAQAIWRDGVTSFLPTLITNSHENLIRNFSILDKALASDELLRESVPGFHLEGPYISPEDGYRGCHPVQHIRNPSWSEFMEYQRAAGGKIILVTMAPELEGATEFIRLCKENGIITSMGHTNSSAEQINNAVENGVKLSTHLGNGCANFIHRHNNPIWPQLANDKLVSTIIADGHHLLPEELKVFLKVKGPYNIILTSDVMYLAGMAPGKYTFMESEVVLTEEGMLINTALNVLAGASFPLKKGVENMMKFTGCSLADAVNMASRNIAGIYGLEDRGTLTKGKRADFILFEKENDNLKIRKTYLGGNLVFQQ